MVKPPIGNLVKNDVLPITPASEKWGRDPQSYKTCLLYETRIRPLYATSTTMLPISVGASGSLGLPLAEIKSPFGAIVKFMAFYARQHSYSAYMPWQFRPSVRPSVCHTGGSVKNGCS